MKTLQKNILILVLLIVAYGVVWAVLSQNNKNVSDDQILGKYRVWMTDRNPDLGIENIELPDTYYISGATALFNEIPFGTGNILIQKYSYFHKKDKTNIPSLDIIRAKDPQIFSYMTQDNPLQEVTIADKKVQKFALNEPENLIGYIIQEKPYVTFLEFHEQPHPLVLERAIQSVKFFDYTEPSDNVQNDWSVYSDERIGVSFEYPPSYRISKFSPFSTEIQTDPPIYFSNIKLNWNPTDEEYIGEAAQINIMRTKDSRILDYLTQEFPLRTIMIAGKNYQFTQETGMGGNSVTFIIQNDPDYVILSFAPEIEPWAMQKTLQSFKVLGPIKQ